MAKEIYNVWSDASYREGKANHATGAGWVVEYAGIQTVGSQRLAELPREARPYGSDIAELQAVALALSPSYVPPGAKVLLRMDCQNVIDWLKEGRMKNKNGISFLENSFKDALRAVASMEKVEFVRASDRNNINMKKANDLARAATSPTFNGKNI